MHGRCASRCVTYTPMPACSAALSIARHNVVASTRGGSTVLVATVYHVRNEPIHALLLTRTFPHELVVGLLTPVTRATLDEMCSVSRRVHREDSTDDSTANCVLRDIAHSLRETV